MIEMLCLKSIIRHLCIHFKKQIVLDDIVTDGFDALSSDKSQAKILVDLEK